ncbi:MAG: LPS assembly protein LptD [Planctomycetia bacterium]|nr:LPS assembly protein LptD [Planctomycetia bacterium]
MKKTLSLSPFLWKCVQGLALLAVGGVYLSGTSFAEESVAEGRTRYRVPTVTDQHGITYPRSSAMGDISVKADQSQTFTEGSYTVYQLEGNVRFQQGSDTFSANRAVFWVGSVTLNEEKEQPERNVLVWLDGEVRIAFVTSRTTSTVRAETWNGRLTTEGIVKVQAERETTLTKAPKKGFYPRALAAVFQEARTLLTQLSTEVPAEVPAEVTTEVPAENTTEGIAPKAFPDGVVIPGGSYQNQPSDTIPQNVLTTNSVLTQGDVSALDPNVPQAGKPRVSVYPRNDVPPQISSLKDRQTGKTIVIFDGGVNVLIDGADDYLKSNPITKRASETGKEDWKVGTIDIATDRLVVWVTGDFDKLDFDGDTFGSGSVPLELYMEGNILFRQGNQEVHAERMYFDVHSRRGIIRDAEVFATIPNFEGLIRLRAEEIRIPEEGMMVANNTFVTTSRIGDPMYRFQIGQLMLRSQKQAKRDPVTGEPVLDTYGEPIMEGPNDLIGRDTVVRVGNVPVFYMPYFAAPLENPSQIINKVGLRKDSIFGWQPLIGFDAYRLFGFQQPIEGTDWDINALWYTKRGPGLGSKFAYDQDFTRNLFGGHRKGYLDFFGIYDKGTDNLGLGRRELIPSKEWRYQLIGKHRSEFGNNLQFLGQIGLISDRNFQEEYFQNSWYREPDRATQFELRQEVLNRSWALWADVRVNDFHTQTQRLPQAEFYWIGQPLFNDVLTWSSYSQAGYTHLYPDTEPTDPNDKALFHLLPWEKNRQGGRASTRHEISYPFQAGPVKVVPFALGEVAYWGENLYGEDTSRVYGQAGIRASLPFWQLYDVQSKLLNIDGIMHKVEFDVEACVAGANQSAYDLPLYDLIDDRAILDFRHHMQNTIFGGNSIPMAFDSRSYAIRSNLGGWVTSPSTELADDLALIRFGMHHRWQTKRGMPGKQRIIDWITFDTNFNLYPDANRDNFGSTIGMLDYDFRWHPGDRFTVFSSGYFDFFSDGLKMVDVGGIVDRPGRGSLFTSLHFLTGPIENVVMRIGYNYYMSPKWTSTFITTFDISGKGNIGESLSFTRVGESFLFTLGAAYDAPSDNFGFHFTLEPRFGRKGNVARLFNIAPPGVYGVD